MHALTLTPDTVGPIARGHPWVYADGVTERAPTGTPVRLLDGRGRTVAFGLAEEGDIAVRVLARHPQDVSALLVTRLDQAARARAGLLPADTDAWRLVNAAGDGLPGLIVDRYGDLSVLRVHGRCWLPHLDAVVHAISAVEGTRTVLRRLGVRNVDGAQGAEVLWGPHPGERRVVTEAGLRFVVRPFKGQKTGLFLDQREHRRFVGGIARGREVLNLFGYTGGFSVFAAAGGAERVTTVDIAADAIEDARENFRLNGLDPDAHAFVSADAFRFTPERPVDLLVCDPPNLSHGRGSDGKARARYRDLATWTGQQVAPGGLLATASCTARLDTSRWEQAIREGLRKAGRWSWLWRAAEPPDHPIAVGHPEGRYLKFAVLRRRG